MLYQDEVMQDLYERKGYLTYLISELPNIEGEKESKDHLLEVEEVINDIISISVEIYKDFPSKMEKYIESFSR